MTNRSTGQPFYSYRESYLIWTFLIGGQSQLIRGFLLISTIFMVIDSLILPNRNFAHQNQNFRNFSTDCSSRFRSCGCENLPRDQPQCGNDNITYFNTCEIECQRKYCKTGVVMLRNGTCDIRPTTRCCQFKYPIEELNFICGSDFQTYGNECEFRCEAKCKPGLSFKRCGHCKYAAKNLDCIAPSQITFG